MKIGRITDTLIHYHVLPFKSLVELVNGKHDVINQNIDLFSPLVLAFELPPLVPAPVLVDGALLLVEACPLSVCKTMDWLRNAMLEALIRAADPSSVGHGDIHGVEQWLVLRSHWSKSLSNSSALGPPLLWKAVTNRSA